MNNWQMTSMQLEPGATKEDVDRIVRDDSKLLDQTAGGKAGSPAGQPRWGAIPTFPT